jgi:hypothetical protein
VRKGTRARLRRLRVGLQLIGVDPVVSHPLERAYDEKPFTVKIQARPLHSRELAPAKSEVGGGVGERAVARIDGVGQSFDLLSTEILRLAPRQTGERDELAGRLSEESLTHRFPEETGEDPIRVPDRPRRQPRGHVIHPHLHCVTRDPVQGHRTERGQYLAAQITRHPLACCWATFEVLCMRRVESSASGIRPASGRPTMRARARLQPSPRSGGLGRGEGTSWSAPDQWGLGSGLGNGAELSFQCGP